MADLLAEVRAERGWSNEQLANALGFGSSHVANLVSGQRFASVRASLKMADRLQGNRVAFARASMQNSVWRAGLDCVVVLR